LNGIEVSPEALQRVSCAQTKTCTAVWSTVGR
jgi:hypothetical protein